MSRAQISRNCWLLVALVTVALLSPVMAQNTEVPDTVMINFRDADIRSVIESVAEITGRSFVLDPRVQGKITIISPQAIDSSLLYEAILSALQVQGFQAVDDGVITRVLPIAQAFQVPTGEVGNELETRVVKVEYLTASEIVALIKPMGSQGAMAVASASTNHIVITDTKSRITRMLSVLETLDAPSEVDIEIMPLTNIAAAEAIYIAGQMRHLQSDDLSIVEDSLNNRIIVSGKPYDRLKLRALFEQLDQPSAREGGVEVIDIEYGDATKIKTLLDGMLQSDIFLRLAGETISENSSASTSAYRIEVDEDNNALIIAASPSVITEIVSVVRRLDLPRSQVLIEAVVAEISEDQADRLSTELVAVGEGSQGNNMIRGGVLTQFSGLISTLLGNSFATVTSDSETADSLGSSTGTVIGAGNFNDDTGEGFGVLIQALKSDSQTNILSTPSILTLDNEEAVLTVGQEVPFITGSFSNNNVGGANPFQTIERREVGVMLKVKPQISEGKVVRLEIEQESSNLLGSATQLGTADVVTAKRTISTNVLVGDGELLVLGGLISNDNTVSESRVPFLGKIPLLGALFRSRDNNDSQRVLMIFIRPTILADIASARDISEQKFSYLRTYQASKPGDRSAGLGEVIMQEFDRQPSDAGEDADPDTENELQDEQSD